MDEPVTEPLNESCGPLKEWYFRGALMPGQLWVIVVLLTAGVAVFSALYFAVEHSCCDWGWYWAPVVGSYIWVAVFLGGLVTLLFVESIRRLYWSRLIDIRQPPIGPRGRPLLHGLIERVLFATLSILMVNHHFGTLALLGGGYIALKAFGRDVTTDRPRYATLLSLWGSGISVAMGILAGGMFWHIEGSLTVLIGRP